MKNQLNKDQIRKDFETKQHSYFESNYTGRNQLRDLRNSIIRETSGSFKFKRVLDVGCGPALLYPEILERCEEYVAVDLVESNLTRLVDTTKSDKVDTYLLDLDSDELPSGDFDLIICSGSLEYMDNPIQNLTRLVGELSKDGVLIASFPNGNCYSRVWEKNVYIPLSSMIKKLLGKRGSLYRRTLFDPSDVLELVANSAESEIRHFGFSLFIAPFDRLFREIDRSLVRWAEYKEWKRPKFFFSEFIVILKRG